MFDVYAWVLSKDVRDHLKEHYELSFEERVQLVRTAYRPIEERQAVLQELRKEAATIPFFEIFAGEDQDIKPFYRIPVTFQELFSDTSYP